MNTMDAYRTRLDQVHSRVREACARAGRRETEVTVVAISKKHPAEAVLALGACGHRVFGENQVQEAGAKIPAVAEAWKGALPEWRLVGHLQRNKAKQAVALFDSIDSADSLRLLRTLQKEAEKREAPVRVLLQFNCSRELQKSGFSLEDLDRVAKEVPGYDRIHVAGLMTIAHLVDDPEDAREDFQRLRTIQDRLQNTWGRPLPELSMGMSHDFHIAIEEGATHVRVGTALFGSREKHS